MTEVLLFVSCEVQWYIQTVYVEEGVTKIENASSCKGEVVVGRWKVKVVGQLSTCDTRFTSATLPAPIFIHPCQEAAA
jgi:hypothetical protein